MKINRLYIIGCFILVSSFLWNPKDDDLTTIVKVPTGILLDTLGNEIECVLLDGKPSHYVSHIFTPVCNTGECLPVKINIYWDLYGKYLKFDQPQGEILTKLDHVPFTIEDYKLLDEILHDNNDPRRVTLAKHDNPSPAETDGNQDQSMPAPQAFVIKTKYEMVDGITGSTLPEVENKFVPGALYTTYTLWGLAHDFQAHMKNYTNFSLVKPKYYTYFLSTDYYQIREEVIALLMGNNSMPNIHAEVCSSILDTSTSSVQKNILLHLRNEEYKLDEVQDQFVKTFKMSSNSEIKGLILDKWIHFYISDKAYTSLSGQISENGELIEKFIQLFDKKFYPTDENFDLWITEIDQLADDKKQLMIQFLKGHKKELSRPQRKKLKKLK